MDILTPSNGTFVNGERLSEEGMLSTLKPLRSGDTLEFGVDIRDDDGKVLYNKVSTTVTVEIVLGPALSPVTSTVNPTGTLKSKTDAEAILSIIADEKTISLEAAETLKKIQSSFDYIEKSALSVGKKKDDLPTDFSKTIAEMNERLAALKDVVDQHNIDLKSYQEYRPQESAEIKSDMSSAVEELKTAITDLKNDTEGDFAKLREDLAKQSKEFEDKLSAAKNDLKTQLATIQVKAEAEEKEKQKLQSSIDSLKAECSNLSGSLNAEKSKNEKLSTQIQSLTKTVQDQAKSIEKLRLIEHSPVKQNNLVAYMVI
ncbi:hypothetical protein HK103_000569 [Boothiomyces macroporosus]|uniref:FHA domain-containing protein n=1 Tax=Boothiomyces macroporosus TaxID=261099 RepID=A0AAD5UL12_9FUNG|nr:hypothetical protein HK103_000569 [Boothiomyces macroporosus]